MKVRLLAISTVLLLASLLGVSVTSTLPSEIEQDISLLNYEHQGRFDYLIHQKASYLFDDIPLTSAPEVPKESESPESEPSNPKYPAEFMDHFDMTFTYELAAEPDKLKTYSAQVEVKAVLRKSNEKVEEVVLIPITKQWEGFTVSFSMDAEDLALSSTTTITANVYATIETTDIGPIFESFTQSLTIQSKGPLLEMSKNLGSTQRASFGGFSYEQVGKFDYTVQPRAYTPWVGINIGPPQPPPPPPPSLAPPLSSKTIGPGETIFPKLIDSMNVTFYYKLVSDRNLSQVDTDVEITAVLEAPKLWTKRFLLLQAEESGNLNVSFPLNLAGYLRSLEAIRTETGASAESYSFTIIANVHTVAETDFGPINETFRQSLSTTLEKGILEWKEELIKTQPGSIKEAGLIPNPNKYLGLSSSGVRNLFIAMASVFFLFFLFSLVGYVKFKPVELSLFEKEALQIRRKHKDVIVDVKELPEAKAEEVVIPLSSFDELLKVADALLKPVFLKAELDKNTYCVIDGITRYQYILHYQ
jgi:hypothetical protein